MSSTIIRARIDQELKDQFEAIVKANDREMSQILRDLIREYIRRCEQGEAWEPGIRKNGEYYEKK